MKPLFDELLASVSSIEEMTLLEPASEEIDEAVTLVEGLPPEIGAFIRSFESEAAHFGFLVATPGGTPEGIVLSFRAEGPDRVHAMLRGSVTMALSWKDLYEVKRHLFGDHIEMVELWPKAAHLIDYSNTRHFYLQRSFPFGMRLPRFVRTTPRESLQ